MINKIGLSTFNEDNINIFGYKNLRESLEIEEAMKKIFKVHNIIIDNEVIMQKVKNNIAIITMLLNVKIIYTSYKLETLYVLEKKLIKSVKVKMPLGISEEAISKIENKSIKPEIYIYNVSADVQSTKIINLSIFITVAFQSLNHESMLLLIASDNLKPNLYEFKTRTKEFIQKTFYEDENIVTATFGENILYIKEEKQEYFLCEIINENIIETLLPYEIENPITINKLSNNTYIITWIKYANYIVSKLLNGRLSTLFVKEINVENLPMYNSRDNKILYTQESYEGTDLIYCEAQSSGENNSFMNSEHDINNLIRSDHEISNLMISKEQNRNYNDSLDFGEFEDLNNFEVKFEADSIVRSNFIKKYSMSPFGKFVGYTIENNNCHKLFLYCTENGEALEINLPLNKFQIKTISFSKREDVLLIVTIVNLCENIYMYNILDKSLSRVTRNSGETIISDFYINNINNCMYISQNDTCDFNLYIIALNNFEIKDIIYLNASNLKIIEKT